MYCPTYLPPTSKVRGLPSLPHEPYLQFSNEGLLHLAGWLHYSGLNGTAVCLIVAAGNRDSNQQDPLTGVPPGSSEGPQVHDHLPLVQGARLGQVSLLDYRSPAKLLAKRLRA